MKKIFALLLVACMLFAFVGCSSDDVRGDITDNSSDNSSVVDEVTDNSSAESSAEGAATESSAVSSTTTDAIVSSTNNSATQEPPVNSSTNNSTTTQTKEPEFSMGKATGKNYENKFLGLGCNLDNNWTFYNDEQIRQLNNVTADLVGEEFAKQIENAQIIYDMMASHSNGTDSMNINLENVGLIGGVKDLRAYLDNSVPMLKQALGNMGFSNITTESITVKVGDKEFEGLDLVAEISGMKFYERLFCIQKGKYIASITMAAFDKAAIEQMTGCFYIVK